MGKQPSPFVLKVWELARSIPSGRVTTYGLLAVTAGAHPRMAQMITSILSRAPDAELMPWHRIVYSNGRVWLDEKYKTERLKRYKEEGIQLDNKNKIIDFEKLIFYFNK